MAPQREEIDMQKKIALFAATAATAANAVVFAHDLLEAGGGFIEMLMGVMP